MSTEVQGTEKVHIKCTYLGEGCYFLKLIILQNTNFSVILLKKQEHC